MPLVTVFMPVYNGEKYVRVAIESILNQTFRDFELLIIDDGSTDGSLSVIREFHSDKIRLLINEKNYGIVYTRNRGLQEANGKYIAPSDCDDIAYPNRLKILSDFLETHPNYVLIGGWAHCIDEAGDIFHTLHPHTEDIPSWLLFQNCFIHSCVMFRKSAANELKYNEKYPLRQDYELWCRMQKVGKMINLPEILAAHRVYPESASRRTPEISAAARNQIIINQLNSLGIYPSEEELQLHNRLGHLQFEDIPSFVTQSEEWFAKLYDANRKHRIYDASGFLRVLNKIRYEAVMHHSDRRVMFSPLNFQFSPRRFLFVWLKIIRKLMMPNRH